MSRRAPAHVMATVFDIPWGEAVLPVEGQGFCRQGATAQVRIRFGKAVRGEWVPASALDGERLMVATEDLTNRRQIRIA